MSLDERSTYSSTVLLTDSVEIIKIIKIAEFKILTSGLKAYEANDTYILNGIIADYEFIFMLYCRYKS